MCFTLIRFGINVRQDDEDRRKKCVMKSYEVTILYIREDLIFDVNLSVFDNTLSVVNYTFTRHAA